MKIDLKGYKPVSQSKTHTSFEHVDGHVIHIAHGKLPAGQQQELKKLCSGGVVQKFATGGDVEPMWQVEAQRFEPDLMKRASEDAAASVTSHSDAGAYSGLQFLDPSKTPTVNQSQAVPQNAPIQAPNQGAVLPPMADQSSGLDSAFGQEQQAYRQGGKEYDQGQQEIQQAAERQRTALEDVGYNFDMAKSHLDDEYANSMDEYAKGEINPRRYMDSLSTGSKISTAIGLLLGGMGSGMLHQENPVMKFLNQQIDRDVESQKANMDKNKNLVAMYYHKFGNAKDAADMAKSVILGTAEADLRAGLSKTNNAQMQMSIGANIAKLQQQKEMLHQQVAQRQALIHGLQNGLPPEAAVPYLVPEKAQKEVMDNLSDMKRLEELRSMLKEGNKGLASDAFAGTFSPNRRQAYTDLPLGQLGQLTTHRFNLDEAKKTRDALMYGRTDSSSTRELKDKQIDRFIDELRSKNEAYLTPYGLSVPKKSGGGFTKR